MSTLVKEPLAEQAEPLEVNQAESLENETPEVDLLDESSTALEQDLDEAVEAIEAETVVETKTDEADNPESKAEGSADVIALKPEDLADIKNKVDSGSEETIATQLSAEQADSTEEAELSEASNVVEANEVAEASEVSESEADDVEVAKAEIDTGSTETSSTEEIDEADKVETAESEEVAELEVSEEDVEDVSDEEAKPSRSRALLLTSLLSTTKPISKKELKKVLKLPEKAVMAAIEDLKTTLYEQDLGLMMEEVAGGYRVIIQPNLYTDLAALISPPPLPQLSSAALETLAIISYKQPITRGELEAARGTGCSSTLDTLQERDLIKILGQKDVVGKPLLYGTTERFLLEFGLKSLEDLPPLDDKPTEFLRS